MVVCRPPTEVGYLGTTGGICPLKEDRQRPTDVHETIKDEVYTCLTVHTSEDPYHSYVFRQGLLTLPTASTGRTV